MLILHSSSHLQYIKILLKHVLLIFCEVNIYFFLLNMYIQTYLPIYQILEFFKHSTLTFVLQITLIIYNKYNFGKRKSHALWNENI